MTDDIVNIEFADQSASLGPIQSVSGYNRNKAVQYAIFLGIFLAFLAIEGLYDYILKIDFRTNFRKNWKMLIPYLILYYSMSYGFIVMVWKNSLIGGALMLALVIIQILINIITHPRKRKEQ